MPYSRMTPAIHGPDPWRMTPDVKALILRHLGEGMPVKQVAEIANVPLPTIYRFVKANLLPFNRPIPPGSLKEAKVCRLVVAGIPHAEIARRFRIAPVVVEEVIERVRSAYRRTRS